MAARSARYRTAGYLDDIWERNGPEGLKRAFHDIAGKDRENAANMLNDNAVRYPSLFALQPEIRKHDLFERLNDRNRFALHFTDGVLAGSAPGTYQRKEEDHPQLRWMLDSGYASDGLNEQYDEVMDKVSLLLSRVYQDKRCLGAVEEMMFNRYRRGAYIYDLVWAYFESSGPDDLIPLAKRLRSGNPRDVELARQLLNFVPCVDANAERSGEKLYRGAAMWLRRNRNRLYYTGESSQMGSNPRRYALMPKRSSEEGGTGND